MADLNQKPTRKTTSLNQSEHFSTPSSDIELKVHFPEENAEDCIENITDVLKHIGIFDGISQ